MAKAWRNVDRWPDGGARADAFALYDRPDRLTPAEAGAEHDEFDPGGDRIAFVRFDDEAQLRFDRWRAGLEAVVRSGDEHPAVESHLAKYRTLVPS
ncbi:MAG: hypothetical protein AVDCRST_MAG64-3987, partial [uncultured Phycisphaerae bacterium]